MKDGTIAQSSDTADVQGLNEGQCLSDPLGIEVIDHH
jgi:hypothetical protein